MKSSSRRKASWEVPILGLIWLLLGWAKAEGQVRLFTTSDGLPSNTVIDIVQTTDGYLWIATPVGVSRFDGAHFDNFSARNMVGMRPDEIKELLATHDGSLWLRTPHGPVCYRQGVFSPPAAIGREPGKLVLCVGPKGGMFAGEAGGKLWSLDGASGRAVADVPEFPEASLQAIVPEGDGSTAWWARASDGRVARLVIDSYPEMSLEPDEKKPIAISVTATPKSVRVFTTSQVLEWTSGAWQPLPLELNDGAIESARWLPDGSAWVSIRAADGTVRLRRWDDGQWKAEGQIQKREWRAILEWITTLGRIWTVTPEGGCVALQLDGSQMRLDEEMVSARRRIQSLFEAKDGTVWLGTVNDGLIQVRPALFQSLGRRQGLADSYVNPVCETRDGALWVGTFGRGLDRYVAGKVTHFDLGKNGTPGYLRSLLEDRADRLWVGLTAGGVLVSSQDGPFQEAFPNSLLHEGARVLLEDQQGGIWIGNSYGAYRWDGSSLRSFTDPDNLGRADVRALAETADSGIWFGTFGRGLWRWRENVWAQVDRGNVQSLYCDPDGVVWIGGMNDGLGCWYEGKVTWFTPEQGVPRGRVTAIVEDGIGYLWLGTFEGILRVSKAKLLNLARGTAIRASVERFDETDGLPARECSSGYQPAGARLRDGRIAIATLGGLVLFDPVAFTKLPPTMQPEAMIEQVSVDGDARTELMLATTGHLELSPGRHNIAFHFVAPYPSSGSRVEVRYKLEEWERDWVAAGASRTVEYRALPPGQYTFRVSAAGPDGVWQEADRPVRLRFLAPLWERPWVRWTAGTLAVGLLLGVWRQFATWKLRRRIAALERETALAQERSRIAQEIHDDLGATLTHISLLTQLGPAADSGSEASLQLREIHASARAATRAVDEIVWALNPEHDTLDSLVNYLIRFAEDFISAARLRCRLALPAHLPEINVTSEVRHHLLLAVKEALHNAVQHAAAAEVRLRLEWDDQAFVFIVEDDGHGFNLDDARAGNGNGITNLHRRLAAVGGTCVVHSSPGTGTQVRLRIAAPVNSRSQQTGPTLIN